MVIKQHIIPASYIGGFSKDIKKSRRESSLFFCRKSSIEPLSNTAENKIFEKLYFEINTDFFGVDISKHPWLKAEELPNFIENQIKDIEDEFIPILQKLEANVVLSEDEIQILVHYMIHIHMRTKRKRSEIADIWAKEIAKKYDSNPDNITTHKLALVSQWLNPDDMDKYLTEEGREIVGNTLAVVSVIWYKNPDIFYQVEMDRFSQYKWDFARTIETYPFLSSDHPVVIWNRCIIFSLNKTICLVWKKEDLYLNVDMINSAIASNAEDEIFGPNKEIVSKYKDRLDIRDTFSLRYLDENLDENALQEEYSRWVLNAIVEKFYKSCLSP